MMCTFYLSALLLHTLLHIVIIDSGGHSNYLGGSGWVMVGLL